MAEGTSLSRPCDGESPGLRLESRKWWPWLATCALVALAVVVLRSQGRIWWCQCGAWFLWSSDIWTSHNSQHLFDAYSFSHAQHGILFYGLLACLCPRWSIGWRLLAATCIEVLWEVFENSAFMIERYRSTTISLDYFGDSIGNSLGDILSFVLGFAFTRWAGFWLSVVVFVVIEVAMVAIYRDSLLLNVLMLVYPLDAVREWQTPA